MKECILCKEAAGRFAHKAYNGMVCRKCRKYLPMSIYLKGSDTDFLMPLYLKNKRFAEQFTATSRYGELFLDSVHGLFCFSRKSQIDGEPSYYGDIFSVTELTEVGIYMDDVKNVGQNTNRITCNVLMLVKTKDIHMKYLVTSGETCKFTKVSGNKLDITEPERLTLFRNLFYQMIDDSLGQLLKKLEDIRRLKAYTDELENTPQACELNWARGVLFLEKEECSPDAVKQRYRELMRLFHPDLHPELDDAYAQKLNKAYEILKK